MSLSSIPALATSSPRSEFFGGVRAELPILLGVLPFGLIYGVLAHTAGIPDVLALLMSSILFVGSGQIVATQLITAGAPGMVMVLTIAVVNIRHMLYSASLASYVKPLRPIWRIVLAYLLTDEAYAVTIAHYTKTDLTPNPSPYRHWYFLGSGLALWAAWQISSGLGIWLGAQLPASWGLDFTLPLTFIALVVPNLTDRPALGAAIAAGGAAVLANGLPYKLGLIVAAFVGIAAGLWLESRRKIAISAMSDETATDNSASEVPSLPERSA